MHIEQKQIPSSHENHHEDQPNIASAEQLLADIPEKMEKANSIELKELLSDIQEKINALREAQEQERPQATSTNIRSAIAKLTEYRDEIEAKTKTVH